MTLAVSVARTSWQTHWNTGSSSLARACRWARILAMAMVARIGRPVIIDADAAQLADDVHDDFGVPTGHARFGHPYLDFRLAIEVAQLSVISRSISASWVL